MVTVGFYMYHRLSFIELLENEDTHRPTVPVCPYQEPQLSHVMGCRQIYSNHD
jgi:hypothetical protein